MSSHIVHTCDFCQKAVVRPIPVWFEVRVTKHSNNFLKQEIRALDACQECAKSKGLT